MIIKEIKHIFCELLLGYEQKIMTRCPIESFGLA